MFPVVYIFGKSFSTYILLSILGIFLGLLFILIFSKGFHLNAEKAIYIYIFAILGGLFGAKILYLVTVLPELIRDLPLLTSKPLVFLNTYFTGGFVFFGGLFCGILIAYWTAKFFKIKIFDYIEVILPAFLFLAGFGRLGCFSAGCCYGKETSSIYGVIFPKGSIAPSGVPLVPTQLIEATFDFYLIPIFLILFRYPKIKRTTPYIYLFSYSFFRFVLEFFRGDKERKFLWIFSTFQWICLLTILVVIIIIIIRYHRSKKITQHS